MNYLHDDPDYNAFVHNHVWHCQSALVDSLLKEQACGVSWEDIVNAYNEEEDEYNEIYEWWYCDRWLLERLEEKGEPILHTDLGDWWGRCTTGQACALDGVLQEIWKDLKTLTANEC